MTLDQEGQLWAAKEHIGVARWTGDAWDVFGRESGLAGVRVSNLMTLHDGSLLLASDQGISRYDGHTWTPYAYPKWFGMVSRWSGIRQSADGSIWLNYNWLEVASARKILNETDPYMVVRHRPESMPPATKITDWLETVSQQGNMHVEWSAHDPVDPGREPLLDHGPMGILISQEPLAPGMVASDVFA